MFSCLSPSLSLAPCVRFESNWSLPIKYSLFNSFDCDLNNKPYSIIQIVVIFVYSNVSVWFVFFFRSQGDIFSGLNDGILSRAEALADIGKHQSSHAQMSSQLKHDVMYHHSMGGPPQRPLQVNYFGFSSPFLLFNAFWVSYWQILYKQRSL